VAGGDPVTAPDAVAAVTGGALHWIATACSRDDEVVAEAMAFKNDSCRRTSHNRWDQKTP
jgi:hypothetical protein